MVTKLNLQRFYAVFIVIYCYGLTIKYGLHLEERLIESSKIQTHNPKVICVGRKRITI